MVSVHSFLLILYKFLFSLFNYVLRYSEIFYSRLNALVIKDHEYFVLVLLTSSAEIYKCSSGIIIQLSKFLLDVICCVSTSWRDINDCMPSSCFSFNCVLLYRRLSIGDPQYIAAGTFPVNTPDLLRSRLNASRTA